MRVDSGSFVAMTVIKWSVASLTILALITAIWTMLHEGVRVAIAAAGIWTAVMVVEHRFLCLVQVLIGVCVGQDIFVESAFDADCVNKLMCDDLCLINKFPDK